tara:strand:- start:649 stop:819 length:171 start_codon:yes stop_codon:yes gene_type:complete
MIVYLLMAVVWLVITEYVFEVIEEKLSWEMKIINFLFFPIVLPVFIYIFIKEFNKA